MPEESSYSQLNLREISGLLNKLFDPTVNWETKDGTPVDNPTEWIRAKGNVQGSKVESSAEAFDKYIRSPYTDLVHAAHTVAYIADGEDMQRHFDGLVQYMNDNRIAPATATAISVLVSLGFLELLEKFVVTSAKILSNGDIRPIENNERGTKDE